MEDKSLHRIDKIALLLAVLFCVLMHLLLRTEPAYDRYDVILEYAAMLIGIPWLVLRLIVMALQPKRDRSGR